MREDTVLDDSVVIAGGGLAGLVCALSLGQAGFRVTVCERSGRLGGKAGAEAPGGGAGAFPGPVEHGPHFVCGWYVNMLPLLRRLGIEERLHPFESIHFLLPSSRAGATGGTIPIGFGFGIRSLLRRPAGHSGPPPGTWPFALQAIALLMDLVMLPDRPELDEMSASTMVRSRWYGSDGLAHFAHDQLLRANSLPGHVASLQTLQRISNLWLRHPNPPFSVFDADLDSALIAPLAREVAKVATIRLETEVRGLLTEEGAVTGVRLADGGVLRAARTVSAVPVEVMRSWIDDALNAADPRLMQLHRLRVAPMGAMQLAFRRPLAGLPPGVVYLWQSDPPINFLDVRSVWRSPQPSSGSHLLVLLPAHEAVQGLSEARALELVLGQLRRYVPDATPENLAHAAVRFNDDAPLFLNTVGSWRDRPLPDAPYGAPDGSGRLYVTGDYAQTAVDLATMESAILAGLQTARAIAGRVGRAPGIEPIVPDVTAPGPRAAYHAARLALMPALAVTKLAVRRRTGLR